ALHQGGRGDRGADGPCGDPREVGRDLPPPARSLPERESSARLVAGGGRPARGTLLRLRCCVSPKFYAVVVRAKGQEHHLLAAKTVAEAQAEARRLLEGYGPKEARVDLYIRTDRKIFPDELVWCRLS